MEDTACRRIDPDQIAQNETIEFNYSWNLYYGM